MPSFKKTIRYSWWLLIEFVKKYLKLILLSFFLSFLFIIIAISLFPYLNILFFQKKEVVGIVGDYDINYLPEEIKTKISNGMFYLNQKGELIPLLISRWEKSKDGLTYRFYLKTNLVWNDGKKLEAADINYDFIDITRRVIDTKTIEFQLKNPLEIFPIYLAEPIIRYPGIGIGGRYFISNMKVNQGKLQSLVLLPQEKELPVLIYRFFRSETQMITAYKTGKINKMKLTKKAVADYFKPWKNSRVIKQVDYSKILTLFFNFKKDWLKDKDVRQAILSAINLANFNEFGEIALTFISPYSFAYNPYLKRPIYDPEGAKKILKKTFSSPKDSLKLITYWDHYDIADSIANDLKEANAPVNLEVIGYEKPHDFDLFLAYLQIPKDPDQYYFWHSTQKQSNISNYQNLKVDKLLEDGRSTLDIKKRKEIYYKLQEIIQNDPPAIFIFFPYVYTIERI